MRVILLLFIVAEIFCSDRLTLDISLNGKSLKDDTLTVFQLICSTNIAVWQCTAEFLIEERTHADIRYANNMCYHTDGICPSNLCACSESCNSFTWNVTIIKDMKNHSYSCATRMVKGGVYYLANVTVKWDGNDGFQTLHKTIVPINVVTQQPTTSKSKSDSVQWPIISSTVGLVTCICTLIVLTLTCRKICISKRRKAPNATTTAPSNGSFPDQTTEAINATTTAPSNGSFPDQMTEDVSMNNDFAAFKGIMKKLPYEPDFGYKNDQAPQKSNNVLSQFHTPEHMFTPDVNMKNNLAAQKVSRTYSYHDLGYQAPQNNENSQSLCRSQKYRLTPAPQKSEKTPSLVRTPDYRNTQDPNSTMNNSYVSVYYSALPGYRNSTSTHSSASGEDLSIYSIKVENRILIQRQGQGLNESYA